MKTRKGIFNFLCLIFMLKKECRGDEGHKSIRYEDVAPSNYDHLTLPPAPDGQVVVVNVSIFQINIRSVDESDMSFTAAIELWQSWDDTRLIFPSWSKKQYQILDSEWIKKLWNPNLYFVNSVDGKMNNIITPSSFFWLTPQKRMLYCCRVTLKLVCEMNLENYPHDEQKCGIKMSSAIFGTQSIALKWYVNSTKTDKCSSLQQFEVLNLENNICEAKIGETNASCLEKTFLMRRRSGYYVINVYIPTILIVLMSMLTFWIPPDAVPARITLGVTSLLTIITKQYQASMPNVSYIVALNIWLSSCVSFVFFSLLEFAAVVVMSTKIRKVGSLFSDESKLGMPLVLLRSDGTWSTSKNGWPFLKESEGLLGPKRLDYISRIVFPVSYILFCTIFWQYYK